MVINRWIWAGLILGISVVRAGGVEPAPKPSGSLGKLVQRTKGLFARPALADTDSAEHSFPAKRAGWVTPPLKSLGKRSTSESPAKFGTRSSASAALKRPRTVSEYMAEERP